MARVEHVVLVGHCGPDSWMLKSKVQQVLPEAQLQMINDDQGLEPHLNDGSLLLVNRVLDGSFKASDGIDLIRQNAAKESAPRMVLISNYPDAQSDAESAGAMPGFGKAELGSKQTEQRLKEAAAYED